MLSAVSLIETALNCTEAFNIHFAAIFEHFQVASTSICFHGNIARSTVRKFLIYPPASTTKIGATVTMLTSLIVGSSSDSCEVTDS